MGHPPTGLRPGERLSDYQRMTIRLPPDVRAELDAASYVLGRPQWRVLVDATPGVRRDGTGVSLRTSSDRFGRRDGWGKNRGIGKV